MYFVYILRTLGNTLYIGVAENLDERIAAHNSGKGAEWTKAHRGARLVYAEPHVTLGSARKREIQLKKWSPVEKFFGFSLHCDAGSHTVTQKVTLIQQTLSTVGW